MSIFFIKTLQLILALSILVLLHEAGHFCFAKWFGIRVEKFFMFFDPKFHLFSTKDKWFTRLFPRFKKSETEYGIGWLPFGGYVKIAGMVDESMDTEQLKQPMQPWEFRSKPAWQRLLVMVGGVLVNFVLALVIYSGILYAWGEDYQLVGDMKQGFSFNETAKEAGFRNGDRLIAADGTPFGHWNASVYRTISEAQTVTVEREGKHIDIAMPEETDLLKMMSETPPFIVPFIPSVIDSVWAGTPAYEAGLRKGDRIMAVDGTAVESWADYNVVMSRKNDILASGCSREDSLRLRQMTLVVQPKDRQQPDTVQLTLTPDYLMGVMQLNEANYYPVHHTDYTLLESVPAGVSHGVNVLKGYVNDLKYLFTADGVKSVGSFGAIGNLFPAQWDWLRFWEITAFLSLMLAFMNILPIPALDGGHVLFLIAEIIMRRPPSDKFLERAQLVGMCLIMGLMLLAVYNDIVRFLF